MPKCRIVLASLLVHGVGIMIVVSVLMDVMVVLILLAVLLLVLYRIIGGRVMDLVTVILLVRFTFMGLIQIVWHVLHMKEVIERIVLIIMNGVKNMMMVHVIMLTIISLIVPLVVRE